MGQNAIQKTAESEAVTVGQAIQNLRERVGLSQEDLAERLDTSRQTISRYEGGRPAILRTDLQRRICDALGVSVQALMEEVENILQFPGRTGSNGAHPHVPHPASAPAAPALTRTMVRVHAQPELRDDGEIHYAEVAPLSSEDLGWMFGPNAGFIRLADGALEGLAGSMRFAGYDKSAWPRAGQGCVIEMRDGEMLPRIYERRVPGGLAVRGAEGATVTLPTANIKGVYAIRFYGD